MTITIIGAGFAGLTAIKSLRKQGYQDDINLISPTAELFYYPSLIWVPAGLRDQASLTVPLDNFFKRYQVNFFPEQVSGLNPTTKTLQTKDNEYRYEQLIIASGGRFIKKLPGIEHVYTPCEGWTPTKAFSDKLASLESGTLAFGFGTNPNEPSAMRGGPIFEFLFGIDSLLRQQKRRHKFDLLFFSPAPQPGKRMGEKAVQDLLKEMQRRGIRTHLGHKIKGFEEHKIITEGGEEKADLVMFMPGVTGPSWAAESGLPLSPGGFIQADAHCRVAGVEEVFIAGDSGSFPGPDWMPKQAHMADLQAEAAVKNLLAGLAGKPLEATFKVELICIVDTLNSGIMVHRTPEKAWHFKSRFFHWAKRFFEWQYLRAYR